MLIEIVLILFIVLVALTATMAVKVGFKALDFIDSARETLKRLESGQEKILDRISDKKPRDEEGS